ncbi:MAG TPA: malonate decarboxylase holo-ACP synthase, partial [Terriglobales bacterium]|nr:malonate decarboxylase holo-ACP synthase [Terriglobales bacterium]
HDLLRIDPDCLTASCVAQPSWVRQSLISCPWVVVRRGRAPAGQIAIGVRGATRSERWGGFCAKSMISKIVRPAELLISARSSTHILRTPAFRALQRVIERWRDLTLPWGPTGSVGFELASGHQVITEASDLDIAIRAPQWIIVEQARSLWDRVTGLRTKVDARVETPECGFSLEEYVCTSTGRILLRYPDGPRCGDDPWNERSNSEGTIS